jgi:hypothetical protein
MYKRSGDTFTHLTVTPTFEGTTHPYITPDSKYVIIRREPYAGVYVYSVASDNLTYITSLPSTPNAMFFTGDSKYIASVTNSAPYINIYKIENGSFSSVVTPSPAPANQSHAVSFATDGTYLAVGFHITSPYFYVYKKDIGYSDATEIDIRYKLQPVANAKELLCYTDKTNVSNFNISGYTSFQNSGAIESYSQVSSSSAILSGGTQEITFTKTNTISNPECIFKIKATKASGSTGTTFSKIYGILR